MSSNDIRCSTCGLHQFHVPALGSELLSLDNSNKCDYCNLYSENSNLYHLDYSSNEEKFEQIIQDNKGNGEYDCIVLFTGGKDSTFTLQLLVKKYKCRVLALTWDNGFFGKDVRNNIENVTKTLGVDHEYIGVSEQALKDFYCNRLNNFGRFCSCANLAVMFCAPRIMETKAPLTFLSVSYGQAFSAIETVLPIRTDKEQSQIILESFTKAVQSPVPIRDNVDTALFNGVLIDLLSGDLMEETVNEFAPYFKALDKLRTDKLDHYFIFPAFFFNWDPETIVSEIKKVGWSRPAHAEGNTHTSCIVEEMKGYLAYNQEIVNYDVLELAMYHRTGMCDSDEYYKEFDTLGYCMDEPEVLDDFLSYLEIDKEHLNSIINNKLAQRTDVPSINSKALKQLDISMSGKEVYERMNRALTKQILV